MTEAKQLRVPPVEELADKWTAFAVDYADMFEPVNATLSC